jgi:hypothetical protein
MAGGRRKSHHTHEVGDAYAEGWNERLRWSGSGDPPGNPYQRVVRIANTAKQSPARRATQQREVVQWNEGWEDCVLDMRLGDLDEVTDADFRDLPFDVLKPSGVVEPEDVDEDEDAHLNRG